MPFTLRPSGVPASLHGDRAQQTVSCRMRRRRLQCQCLSPQKPNLSLCSGSVPVHIFGVQHLERQAHIGEHILRSGASAVVVETALTPQHGAQSGNVFQCEGEDIMHAGPFARMLCYCARQLAELPSPADTPVWESFQRQFGGEQLAYIAALAVGAALIFGDQPKELTYQRLMSLPSLSDLDRTFGSQAALNYEESLSGQPAIAQRADYTLAQHIMQTEREAVLCQSLHKAANSRAAGQAFRQPLVVGVVGEAHLEGIAELWENSRWQGVLDKIHEGGVRDSENKDGQRAGVRRALAESVLRLSCVDSVLADVSSSLGPVPADQAHAYSLTRELYGTTRMLLACLPKADLAKVCCGWRCDMYEELQPLRALRPCNSGVGFDESVVLELRALDFDVPPSTALHPSQTLSML
ncbi:g10725 [Coccomyxa viridis]|uniref:G10725 protein n=1 Tax=Coccomyxa viridis TaxID=1274662 RepID=A0ABP1G8U6_9CHLO